MSNLQILVENIRTSILFPETVPPEQMRLHAKRYAEACAELNERMTKCIGQIRAGNIAEGIRLAELKPSLPEMYLSLDMPEREDWDLIVSTLNFDQAPRLPEEFSRELNDAYLKMSPLEPLLRWHRLYALNGSPVRDRLAVLRAIAKADHENMFWIEDQEKFEKVRFRELDREIRKAIETNDNSLICSLHTELSSPDWVIQPPPEFRRKLTERVLQSHVDVLMKHFAAFDHDNAKSTYDTMRQILFGEQMEFPPAVLQTIRPAVMWLEESQRQNAAEFEFDSAMMALEEALEEETPRQTLERLYYDLGVAATQAGTVIPEELVERYRDEITRQHTAETRRNQLLIVGVIAGCLLLGVLVAWGLNQRYQTGRVRETIATLEKIETEKRLEDIPGTIEQIETNTPGIAENVNVAAAIVRLREMLKSDETRAADFLRYHADADAKLETQEKPTLPELGRIKISVDQAEKLVRTPQEKTLFTELKRKYESALAMRKRETDDRYSRTLTEISDEFNAVRRDADLPAEVAINRLEGVARRIEPLQRSENVSKSLLGEGEKLAGRVADEQKKMERKLARDSAMQKLFAQVPNWTDYRAALRQFADEFPDHHAASDAAAVLKELDEMEKIAGSFHDLANSYTRVVGDFDALQQASEELLEKYREISSQVSGPAANIFPPGNLLEKLTKVLPYTPDTLKSTESYLKNLTQKKLYPWIDGRNEQWYYLTKRPERAEHYNYITSFVAEERRYRIRENEFDTAKIPMITQQDFAESALRKIDGIRNNAEIIVGEIINDLLRKTLGPAPGLDPILQCVLMNLFITDMSRIDPFFADTFGPAHKIIQDCGVDMHTNWMDIQSQNTVPQRNMARTAIARLPEMRPLGEKAQTERNRFKNTLRDFRPGFDWVGCLVKKEGRWSCEVKSGTLPAQAGDLYIFRLKEDQTMLPVRIGKVSGGNIGPIGGESSCIQCLPVFFVQN